MASFLQGNAADCSVHRVVWLGMLAALYKSYDERPQSSMRQRSRRGCDMSSFQGPHDIHRYKRGVSKPALCLPNLPDIWGTEGSFALATVAVTARLASDCSSAAAAVGDVTRSACNRREEAAAMLSTATPLKAEQYHTHIQLE